MASNEEGILSTNRPLPSEVLEDLDLTLDQRWREGNQALRKDLSKVGISQRVSR